MDPLSVAASVAGVAATGVQLSQTIYDLISTFYEAEKEMSSIANDLSLLAMVLNELEGVLQRDSRVYQRRMLRVVNDILNNCEGVFQSISKYISINPGDTRSSKQFRRRVCWYFQRHRVGPLQAGLESMKSTLNVLLHVVHLARVTEAAESFIPSAGRVFTQADVQKERRVLVGVVLDNRRSILSLKQIEEDRDRGQHLRNIIEDKRDIEGTDSEVVADSSAPKIELKHGPRKMTERSGFNSFGGWGGGSIANTGTNTSLSAKAAKDSATDTGNKQKQKDKFIITRFDTDNLGTFDEKQGEEAEEINAGGGDDWGAFTTTTKTEHKKKSKDSVEGTSNVFPKTNVIATKPENMEATADDSWGTFAWSKDKKGRKREEEKKRQQKEMEDNNQRSLNASPDPSIPTGSASHSEHDVEVYEISEAGSNTRRPKSFRGRPEPSHTDGADDLSSASESHTSSPSQSPASENYSIAPEIPVKDAIKASVSLENIPSMRQSTASAKGLATKSSKSQTSPPETEIVTPTAQWFLSVVPHESKSSALIVRPRSAEANHLRARAEETVKTLLLNWTNVDPDVTSGVETSGGWNSNDNSTSHPHGPARNERASNQPYRLPYTPQAYPTYAPQQWYPPAAIAPPPRTVFTLPPSPPAASALPSALNEKQTDIEELARLKKLILDEKAEQDTRAAAAAAAAPPAAPIPPIATDEFLEDTMQSENAYMGAIDSPQMPQEDNTLWVAEPPRRQPVIMRDWLGRKFIFPVDMCQSWEGLDILIQEAFGHVLDYRPMVEKGCYSISHVTGEVILPSTWESFVKPGLEIDMEVYADRDDSGGTTMVSGRRAEVGQETLIPPQPHAPEVPTLGSPMALRSRSDDEPAIDDVADDGTDYSFSDGISYVERSDPRYLSIENVLLEQKKAKVEAEMKLERNRRFFQLKQQLVDQGAAIQARENAAEHAEQDTKLAWLEKQVRDQKEELDRLPPLLMTPPSSSAGDSLSKSASSPQRKPSFRARLLARMPSRSIHSRSSIRSQQMITEG